ncbi:MAG: DUF1822 family protein [Leptolyngbyaceae cyanobacterium bins.302]|nr:DUF1822 family protein [Leptolyngbyaceae cyanobacterium bins.302]
MMQSPEDTFTMPLTLKAHHLANQFRQQQADTPKAKQVYLNSLAVQVVESYLNWFGVKTDLQHSDSWNPTLQALADTADLMVIGKGKLECRPMLPGETVCRVPPEVWSERIGYVAVQFNSDLTEATLLGFVPSVAGAEIPLTQLRSLEELLDLVYTPTPKQAATTVVSLGQWLEGLVATGWQTIEDLFGLQQPVWSFRSGEMTHSGQVVPLPMTRGKILELGQGKEAIALLIGLTPTNSGTMDIWVKVCPTGATAHLPADLELLVLDATGVAVMQAQSRNTEMIQLKFNGISGERFSIRVILYDCSLTEDFVI